MDRHAKDRNPLYLYLSSIGLILISIYINAIAPNGFFPIAGLFFLVASTSYLLTRFLSNSAQAAAYTSTILTIVLLLRYFNLRNPVYIILLLASTIALYYAKRESSKSPRKPMQSNQT